MYNIFIMFICIYVFSSGNKPENGLSPLID